MKDQKNNQNSIIDSILHDVKSPLSNIAGYTKLLLSNVVGELNQEQRDYLSRVRRNIYRISLYVDDVADAARILHFQEEPSLSQVNLKEILEAAVERNETVLNDFRSSFFLVYQFEDTFILSDKERLSRTIDVLISNLTKDVNKRKILLALKNKNESVDIIISHAAESNSNIDVFMQRFEKADEKHLIQHAATSTVIIRAIGGSIAMFTSNISERMFVLSFPLCKPK